MGLNLIKAFATKRYDLSDGAWIDLKASISKRDFITLMSNMAELGSADTKDDGTVSLTVPQAVEFQQVLFATLAKGWSIDDPCTVENYMELERASADEVDKVIVDHFQSLMPSKDESGKPETSRAGRRKA